MEEAWTCGNFYEPWAVVATVENFFGILIPIICKVRLLSSIKSTFDGESRNIDLRNQCSQEEPITCKRWEENQACCQFYITPYPISCQMKVMSEVNKAGSALCEARTVLGSIQRCAGGVNSGNKYVFEIFPFMTLCY